MTTFNLRTFRKEQGVSQAWLAHKLGIHRATIARYEQGVTKAPRSFYYQLAHVLRYPIEKILPAETDASQS